MSLEAERNGKDFDFYYDNIRRIWDPSMNPWDEYVEQAKAFIDTRKLDSEEIDYKVNIGQKLAVARKAVLAEADGWGRFVKSGLANSNNNLIYYTQISNFCRWIDSFPADALNALNAIWAENKSDILERIASFSTFYPRTVTSGAGTRMNVISVLLMGLDVHSYPPFRVTAFHQAYERTGYDQPPQDADEAALYEHAIGFLDRFIEASGPARAQIAPSA